jgi:hypothetical protein
MSKPFDIHTLCVKTDISDTRGIDLKTTDDRHQLEYPSCPNILNQEPLT